MSSFITYNHPSLVLGNVVDTGVLDCLGLIQASQNRAESAYSKLNSLIIMKNSVNMTINELKGLGIDTSVATDKVAELDAQISAAAADYMTEQMQSQQEILEYKNMMGDITVAESPESPIDMTKSSLTLKPTFSDSLTLDSRFFSFAGAMSSDTIGDIEKFVRASTSNISGKSNEIANKVSEQVSNQLENKKLCGTLIIVANCTHRNTNVFDPLVIDPNKAIAAWNSSFPDDAISTTMTSLLPSNLNSENKLHIISGAVYGSSFVGMVHMLRTEMSGFDNIENSREQLDEKLRLGGWLESMTGGFGVDEATVKDVRAFLSTESIDTHISIVSMGAIPTIKADSIKSNLKTLAEVDNTARANILTNSDSELQTTTSESKKSNNRALMSNIQNERLERVMTTMGKIEKEENSILNLNSLMTAFQSYVDGVKKSDVVVGVPISFYTRVITKAEIIKLFFSNTAKEEEKKEEEKKK